jgi:hypothetical protein
MQTMDNVESKCYSVFRAMNPGSDIEMPDDRLELRLGGEDAAQRRMTPVRS